MGRSEESKRQQLQYEKDMTRSFRLKLNRHTDADIIAWLESQPNIQGYIKEALRRDMGRSESIALKTLADAAEISKAVEAAEEDGDLEKAEELLDQMPSTTMLIDARRVDMLRWTVSLTPVERFRIRSISEVDWKAGKRMELKDIKEKYNLTWSEMELIHRGWLNI